MMSAMLLQNAQGMWSEMMGGHGDPYVLILFAAVGLCMFVAISGKGK